jgi:hypothetical protein
MMIVVFGLAALLTFLIGLYFVLVHLGKTVLPDAIARYLTLHTHYSKQPDGFEVAIGLKHQVHASTLQITKQRELRMKYTIPASLCDKGGQMHVGGFMALADSVTSILVVCFDPQKRPGVSVVLTGELIGTKSGEHAKFTTSGTDIWIVASVEKIGLNMSFTKCAFYASAQPGYELDMSTATLLPRRKWL